MDMQNRVPDWLTPVAWAFITVSLLAAAVIAYDTYGRGRRSGSVAHEVVWITSALYLGPLAVMLHRRHGGSSVDRTTSEDGETTAVAGLPGGSASAIAHLVGVPLVVASGITIAGIDLWVMIIVIGVLAIALLSVHARISTRSADRPLPMATTLAVAAVTVLAFDVGMGGWMLLLHFNEYMPPASEGSFWFLMQIGIVLGLLTGYPVVRVLALREPGVSPT